MFLECLFIDVKTELIFLFEMKILKRKRSAISPKSLN